MQLEFKQHQTRPFLDGFPEYSTKAFEVAIAAPLFSSADGSIVPERPLQRFALVLVIEA